jgi:hypothetical protein
MKKLHLITSTDSLRPALQNIQVKNGFCYATNCHVLAKIAKIDVFGPDVISNDEEIYFPADQWKKQNFAKAVTITREGLLFKAFDKKHALLGMIQAKTAGEIEGKFPDCETVIPTSELSSVDKISFDHSLYFNLVECFNDEGQYRMEFRGQNKGIIIRNLIDKNENIGLIMPKYLSKWDEEVN